MSAAPGKPSPPHPPHSVPQLDARGLPVGYPLKSDWEVTPRETRDKLAGKAGPRPLLLDCRRADEFAFNRIQGATHVPMDQITARADEIEEAAGGKDKEIIVQCHSGRRSLQVAATLRGLGFTSVKSLAGGIDLWSVDIDPQVPRY
jgi:rhodanese-related sulfurtransferase